MRDCAKFLFNHNPFYPLSAALIMVGLREAMQSWGTGAGSAWWLAQWLGAYTILLAVTAVVIIRAGKVWDDARTICLLVVLMFMAMSASFDTLCVELPSAARILLATGWLFAIVVTEWMTRSARFKFPILYRAPFYALLGLFFCFPAVVTSSWWEQVHIGQAWRVLSFSSLAGLLTLTLLPAIRRGASYVSDNGSPWNWPLYPWSVFFFIAIGVCGRAYLLTLSFQNDVGNESSFAGYYLLPFALAVLVIIAEVAIVHRLDWLKEYLLVAPALLVGLAMVPGSSNAYETFLGEVSRRLGTPLWLSLVATVVYLLYLGCRGIKHYQVAMAPVLVALVGIGPQTRSVFEYEPQQVWPLVLFVGYNLAMLLRKPTGARFSFVWVMGVIGACVHWHGTSFTRDGYLLPWHLVLLGVWLSCLIFSDAWALYWRRRLPAIWSAAAIIAGAAWWGGRTTQWQAWLPVYLVTIGMLALLTWFWLRMALWKWSTVSVALVLLAIGAVTLTRGWQPTLPARALQTLALGAVSFLVGGTISAAKAGITLGSPGFLKREWQKVRAEWNGTWPQA